MAEITVASVLSVLQAELAQCEYGEVSLTLTVHGRRIVRWRIARQYGSPPSGRSPVIDQPHPTDNA